MFAISQYYQTEESVEMLYDNLINKGGLYESPSLDADKTMVNWKLKAYGILASWVLRNPEAHSLSLLRTLNKTNPNATRFFSGSFILW